MTVRSPVVAPNGLATLDAGMTRTLRELDSVFLAWADAADAAELSAPMLLPVDEVARLGVFDSFPHMALAACPLDAEQVAADPGRYEADGVLPAGHVRDSRIILPSAACYGVYLNLAGQTLDASRRYTVLGHCFRNEREFSGLRRLLGFRMREIVHVGTGREALAHLEAFVPRILALAEWLGLDMSVEAAEDPFFDQSSGRAQIQQALPVKREFVVDGLAIASVNLHRDFFGTRAGITLAASGRPAQTSCVAFGLERWLAVLDRAYASDWDAVRRRVTEFEADPAAG
jgi:seryl-tRNA synthetase